MKRESGWTKMTGRGPVDPTIGTVRLGILFKFGMVTVTMLSGVSPYLKGLFCQGQQSNTEKLSTLPMV